MSEKSYVSLGLCFFCFEAKEVLLDQRLQDSLPRSGVYNYDPCPKCAGYMKQGIILISASEKLSEGDRQNPYRTGGWVVVTEEAVRCWLKADVLDEVLKKRVAFLDDPIWDQLGLPRGEEVTCQQKKS